MIHILINLFIKGIRIQNILVVDSQENGSSRVLLFGKFNGEDLLVRESEFLEHIDIAVVFLELLDVKETHDRLDLH